MRDVPVVDRLLLDHAPAEASRVLLVDPSDELLAAAHWPWVGAWCDDVRRARACAHLPLDGTAEVALLRLPGSLDELDWRAGYLAARGVTTVVGSANTKHMSLRQNDVLARHFREVRATRGVGKYRALVASGPLGAAAPAMVSRVDETTGLTLCALGPVFAGARVDAGTRLLLGTSRRWPVGAAVDVGCGNGVISAVLAGLGCAVTSVDVSRAALDSTAATLVANRLPAARLLWGDGITELADGSADLVVSNPPFHVGEAKDSTSTLAFLRDAARVLRPGGELWCVFNSHLPYVDVLRERFDVEIAARDRAYTVARAVHS